MKFKMLLFGLALVYLSLPAVGGASAQGCKAELMSGPDGIIIDIFNEATCTAANNRCNGRLRQLRLQEPYFYRAAYCNTQPVPPPYVIRTYSRCQSPGIVHCAQEWSNGRIVIEDHPCPGCRRYGNPVTVPCGWKCSFPQN